MAENKKLSELEENSNNKITLLLIDKITQKAKNGSSYVDAVVSDGDVIATAKIWNSTAEEFAVDKKALFTAIVFTKPYNGQRSYEIAKYDAPPEGAKPEDFIRKAPYKSGDMAGWITAQLEKAATERPEGKAGIANLGIALYLKFADRLEYWPAAMSMHHCVYGGLLYHCFMMMRAALQVGNIYGMDMEVLLTGIALHDIGKLYELDSDELGNAEYSVNGNLFGHPFIGARLVGEAAKEGNYDPEQVRMVEHIILSHHGNREWGAVTLPATREALLVSRLDEFDAKLYQYDEALKNLGPGEQSARIRGIGGVVYNPGIPEDPAERN